MCVVSVLYLPLLLFLIDDIQFVVIGQKLVKHTALQKALKVQHFEGVCCRNFDLTGFADYMLLQMCCIVEVTKLSLMQLIVIVIFVKCSCVIREVK